MQATRMVKAHINSGKGHEGHFFLLPFNGDGYGKHRFNDHNHARNFVRYLYSQSRAHPENVHTGQNLIREFAKDGTLVAGAYNDAPNRRMGDFLRRRFPEHNAQLKLLDDGAYPLFILKVGNGPLMSNFLTQSGNDVHIEHPLAGHLEDYLSEIGSSIDDAVSPATAMLGSEPLVQFDDIERGSATLLAAENFVHAVVRKLLGNGQNVVLTVAHRDQHDHNPNYHVHRLLTEVEEVPCP